MEMFKDIDELRKRFGKSIRMKFKLNYRTDETSLTHANWILDQDAVGRDRLDFKDQMLGFKKNMRLGNEDKTRPK